MTTISEKQAVPVVQEYPASAIGALTGYQRQIDSDGTFVGVSRQALDEVMAWAEASRLTPIEGVAASELPVDVRALVIAAREFWDDNNDQSDESTALDKALEAFSSRVPYDDEPTPSPAIPEGTSGEGVLVDELRAVARAMELVDFRAREPDLDLNPSACRAIVKDAIAALQTDATQTREAELVAALRDAAHDLVSTASHHGSHAAIDQDKINCLRDTVGDFDAALSAGAAKGEAR